MRRLCNLYNYMYVTILYIYVGVAALIGLVLEVLTHVLHIHMCCMSHPL